MRLRAFLFIFCGVLLLGIAGTAYAQEEDPLKAFLDRARQTMGTDDQQANVQEAAEESALPSVEAEPRTPAMGMEADQSGEAAEGQNPYVLPQQGTQFPMASPQISEEELEAQIRRQAFDAALTGLLPLKPDEIREVMEAYDKTRQAAEIPIYPYPEPIIAVTTASIDPGSDPVEVRVSPGHVTTISVMDITGKPWAIQDLFWAGDFEVVTPEQGGNIFRITPLSDFTYGNMSLQLVELGAPISLILKAVRDEVHYRLDVRVPEYGPEADMPLIGNSAITLAAGDKTVNSFLDGVIPSSAERMDVLGTDKRTMAYKYADRLFVRTPLSLLSPSWSKSASSADGMNVYELVNTPVLLLSDNGSMVRVRIEPPDNEVSYD